MKNSAVSFTNELDLIMICMEEHEVQSIIVIGEIEREYIMPILCKFHICTYK